MKPIFKVAQLLLLVAGTVSGCASAPRYVYNEPSPENLVALSAGDFTVLDMAHWADGTATVSRGPDGGTVLRLEEGFEAARGPDLYVVLSERERPRDGHRLGEYVTLGELKSNVGSQNYAIPADVDLSAYKSVVIYCVSFEVIFSTATLAPVPHR